MLFSSSFATQEYLFNLGKKIFKVSQTLSKKIAIQKAITNKPPKNPNTKFIDSIPTIYIFLGESVNEF